MGRTNEKLYTKEINRKPLQNRGNTMKKISIALISILLLTAFNHAALAQSVDEVVSLVRETRQDIERNSDETFSKINKGEHPYRDARNSSLYVFVINTDYIVMAHGAIKTRIGQDMRGEVDSNGKSYTDEMIKKAIKYGMGWSDYNYINPKTNKWESKLSYCELAVGSDGVEYIIGSGLYYDKAPRD